jgi:F-type H+-transporting ATPase subunit delta
MSASRVASRYAKSLFELALEQGSIEKIHQDIQYFDQVAKNRDFEQVLQSPIIKEGKKVDIIRALFKGKVDDLVLSFLELTIGKRREAFLPLVSHSFGEMYREYKQISRVKITSAMELNKETIDKIIQKLKDKKAVSDNIELETTLDPELIGGFIIRYDDKLYDASIARKLFELEKDFNENTYIKNF